ncbi:PREDICTED: histidine-containing phosphotransfer protein 4-like [Ipomoea nil]|uniref:histidine-containing phosphotransfer protein 4-like n=1 Tax=Ipomoea nil TaxID=35883 RepID=UPI000900AB24|nr:PREDICTED: histidine-containing phosphotransfer protein 4-like [Ipomoea nil]
MPSQAANLRKSLFDQGYIDDQFIRLEELQDDSNPNFLEEVVRLFYNHSTMKIHNIELALESGALDFTKLDDMMIQFKGSCSSIGARKVNKECLEFKQYCDAGNIEGCRSAFQRLKQELYILKTKLEIYFQMAKQGS